MSKPSIANAARTGLDAEKVNQTVHEYTQLFDEKSGGGVDARKGNYEQMVNHYYDLVTDFYEYGWGHSFHFAPRYKHESFADSLRRHEYYLALRLALKPDMKVLDIGCGVGGPMRNIARFSGATVVGINNNDYQIVRGRKFAEDEKLSHLCHFQKGDFTQLNLEDNHYDAAYAIEATCHAPDRVPVFSGIYRALKPGGYFAGYEWCTTAKYQPENAQHQAIKKGIEEGDALPDLTPTHVVDQAIRSAGFELLETCDLSLSGSPETPWYGALDGREWNLKSLPRTTLGRFLSHNAVRVMELLRIAPKGATQVSRVLNKAADALVAGGRSQIFTPMYFFIAQKKVESGEWRVES